MSGHKTRDSRLRTGDLRLKTHGSLRFVFCVLIVFLSLLCLAFQIPESSPTQSESPETVRYIRRIIFNGNSAINDETLVELLAIQPGQKFNPQSIDSALPRVLAEYKKLGYILAKVEWEYRPAERDQVTVYVGVQEGEMIKMGRIETSGNTIFSRDQLINRFNILRNPLFDDSVFQEDMDRLLRLYSNNGHPLVRISPSEFRVEDGKLNLKVDIDEGPLVKIQQVQMDGLKKTKEEVILRELAVQPGDVFDQRKIDESQRRLNNIGYFQTVDVGFEPSQNQSSSQPENSDVILNFLVKEGRTGSFSGILGYNPSEEESGAQKFTGRLEIAETNLLGTGRQLAIKGNFGLIDTYELAYKEPWIFDAPVDVGIRLWGVKQSEIQDAGFRMQDIERGTAGIDPAALNPESFREWAASLSGTTRAIRSIESSLAVTYKRIEIVDSQRSLVSSQQSAVDSEPENSNYGQKYSLTVALQRDSRDYFLNPSTGRLDRVSAEISRGDFKTVKMELDLNQYFKTWQQQTLALGFHGARIWGERIPPTEILRLGGANTLRGYSEDFFRGEGRLFANCEYRFLVSRDSQFFLFLDGGSVYNKNDGISDLKLGYGVGMRLRSRTGLVSVDYGLARGDSVLSGKIHVSLGATF